MEFEKEREEKWKNEYEDMRIEMLEKYKPDSRSLKTFKKQREKELKEEAKKQVNNNV